MFYTFVYPESTVQVGCTGVPVSCENDEEAIDRAIELLKSDAKGAGWMNLGGRIIVLRLCETSTGRPYTVFVDDLIWDDNSDADWSLVDDLYGPGGVFESSHRCCR